MLSHEQFAELISRIRAGDEDAARECVKMYENEIRRAARLRLTDPRLRQIVDSMDICQSVFGRFFKGASEGSLELDGHEQVLGLLVTMTRNRVIDVHRRHTARKRSLPEGVAVDPLELPEESPGPKTAAVARDLLRSIRSRLRPEELLLVERRYAGDSWEDLAAELQEPVPTLRKRAQRAMQRVRAELSQSTDRIADRDNEK